MFGLMLSMADPERVQVLAHGYFDLATSPTPASVTVKFDNDGNVYDTGVVDYAWMLVGSASDYEWMWHRSSGDTLTSAPAEDTWLGLGTDRSLTLTVTGGSKSTSVLITIRPAGGGAWTRSATITLTVESTV